PLPPGCVPFFFCVPKLGVFVPFERGVVPQAQLYVPFLCAIHLLCAKTRILVAFKKEISCRNQTLSQN
ncbi:hypothetical protein, partial [Metabacillus mangrovi]|uniref:hypothetical protein n=1 Tax=Metabacillus mangrovi TaxID=1491830 RepID=UPI0019D63020